MSFAPSNTLGPYLPVNQTFSQEPKLLWEQITKSYADTARTVNLRQIAIYQLNENPTGEQWFTAGNPQTNRQSFRTVYNIGAIASGATLPTLHGLTNVTSYTHIYGTAVTSADNRPIPYSSVTNVNQQIEIKVDGNNITIINGSAALAITSAIVVLEYLKN